MASYNNMQNKPTINNVQLKGAKQFADYGINPIMYDAENDNLYTIVDGAEFVVKEHATSPLPEGYTQGNYVQTYVSTPAFGFDIGSKLAEQGIYTGEIDYIVKMSFDNPTQQQLMGYYLAANAYFGINCVGKIAAEWSINDDNTHGIDDVDPTDVNVIHVEFRNGERTRLTIEGSDQVSLGYPGSTGSFSGYSTFVINDVIGSGVRVPASFYKITFNDVNGTTLMDLYPCKRDSDDAVGFYDIAGNTFYPVSGELH